MKREPPVRERVGLRGGSFYGSDGYLHASIRYNYYPTDEKYYGIGFRVSEAPEPAAIALLALGGVVVLGRRRR